MDKNKVVLTGKIIKKVELQKITFLTLRSGYKESINFPQVMVIGKTDFKEGDFVEINGVVQTTPTHKEPQVLVTSIEHKKNIIEKEFDIPSACIRHEDDNYFELSGTIVGVAKYPSVTLFTMEVNGQRKVFAPLVYYMQNNLELLEKGKRVLVCGAIQTKKTEDRKYFTNYVIKDFTVLDEQ